MELVDDVVEVEVVGVAGSTAESSSSPEGAGVEAGNGNVSNGTRVGPGLLSGTTVEQLVIATATPNAAASSNTRALMTAA